MTLPKSLQCTSGKRNSTSFQRIKKGKKVPAHPNKHKRAAAFIDCGFSLPKGRVWWLPNSYENKIYQTFLYKKQLRITRRNCRVLLCIVVAFVIPSGALLHLLDSVRVDFLILENGGAGRAGSSNFEARKTRAEEEGRKRNNKV